MLKISSPNDIIGKIKDFQLVSKGLYCYSLLFIFLTLATFTKSIKAQNVFYSPQIESLYKLVNQVCIMDSICINDTVLQYVDSFNGDTVPIILHKDENGIVDHIGYIFLPDTLRIANLAAIQFIEREMLTILTTKDVDTALRTSQELGLRLMLNDAPISPSILKNKKLMISFLKDNKGIVINRVNMDYLIEILCSNDNRLSFSFPADCKLISGMDKREQEIRLAFQLKNHIAKSIDSLVSSPNIKYLQLLQDSICQDSIYVEKGYNFNIPQINNDLFYVKNDSLYSLVSDTSFIALSFSNTLISPSPNVNYTINIKHRMYGNTMQDYMVDSRNFNDYFSKDYERYFGIETLEPQNLSGTLILYNRDEEFIHLAYVTTTLEDLINGGKMTMELFSNIPQHNIKALFGN